MNRLCNSWRAQLHDLWGAPAHAQLSTRHFQHPRRQDGRLFGDVIAGVPDVNGDGRGDIVIGAPGEGPGAIPGGARLHLLRQTGALLHILLSPHPEPDGSVL